MDALQAELPPFGEVGFAVGALEMRILLQVRKFPVFDGALR